MALKSMDQLNLRTGTHRVLALIVLFGAFVGFALSLGSVAGLQAVCDHDLELSTRNDIFKVKAYLEGMRTVLVTAGPAGLTGAANAANFYGGLLQSLSILSARSTTGAYTLTPEIECSRYYRYQWLGVALQAFTIVVATIALATHLLHTARVAVVALLTVSTVLAIDNAHTFLYMEDFAPGVTLTRGKVFFVGCLVVCGANLLLCIILGVHDEKSDGHPDGRASRPSSEFPVITQLPQDNHITKANAV